MRICLISMNLYSYGGIQRVLSGVLNELLNTGDVHIDIIMPYEKNDENVFGLDSRISVYNYNDFLFKKNKLKVFFHKIFKRINKETGVFGIRLTTPLLMKFFFSDVNKNKLVQFLNQGRYNTVIGVGELFSLLLSDIRDKVECGCIGWMHSTFESYYLIRGGLCYGTYEYAKKALKKLDFLLVLTKTDQRAFEQHFGVKTYRLQNPVNYFCERPEPNIDGPVVFVGRMVKYHKGLDYLLKVIEYTLSINGNIKFVLVGDGPDKKWLEKSIKQRGLTKSVAMPGMRKDIEKILEKGSLLLHTSRYEGFGVVIVEAMMFGLPVVAFHNNGPDEIITDSVDGYLIDKYDCKKMAYTIESTLENIDKYKKMSAEANKTAKGYTPEIIASNMRRILEEKEEKEILP